MGTVLSPTLLARFRNVALERIEKVEAGWVVVSREGRMPETEATVLRELHTLKGESSVVGFGEAASLCQAIEDIFAAAQNRQFSITDDIDILATMALQFLRIVVRRKDDGPIDGLDLPRFLSQIEELVAEEERKHEARVRTAAGVLAPSAVYLRAPVGPTVELRELSTETRKLSASTRRSLARLLIRAFLESAASPLTTSATAAWRALAFEWSNLESVPLDSLLRQHIEAAEQIAAQTGKRVQTSAAGLDLRCSVDVADALGTFVLHAFRNAIVHGIEGAEERAQRKKPASGTVRITASHVGDYVQVVVEDDGGGVPLEAVQARAVELGLLENRPMRDEEVLQVLFKPGFSTAESVTQLAGRGVGLDAVQAGLTEVGGRVQVTTEAGRGTRFVARAPSPTYEIDAHRFVGACSGLTFALSSSWAYDGSAPPTSDGFDPGAFSGVAGRGALPSGAIELRFRRGESLLRLLASGPPTPTRALRLLVTKAPEPELVAIGDDLAILLRPDVARASLRV